MTTIYKKFLDTVATRLFGPVENNNFVCGADFITSQHMATISSNIKVNSTCPLIHHPRMMPSHDLPSSSCLRALSVLGTSFGSRSKPTLSNKSVMLRAFSFPQSALMPSLMGTLVRYWLTLRTRIDLRVVLILLILMLSMVRVT